MEGTKKKLLKIGLSQRRLLKNADTMEAIMRENLHAGAKNDS